MIRTLLVDGVKPVLLLISATPLLTTASVATKEGRRLKVDQRAEHKLPFALMAVCQR